MILYPRITLLASILMLLTACSSTKRDADGMYPYDKNLDRAFILQQFEHDRFWLVADESAAYNPADTLDTGIHQFVRAKTYYFMYYQDKKPVGFISYYYESPFFAKIQFVYVDKDHRRQGIAEKMIRYVLERQRKEGAHSVEILTRLINTGALTLYEKLGFKKLYDTGKYIYLEYIF